MSEERDGLEPDDIEDLELVDEDIDELEPDDDVDDEPEEPVVDPRERRRQAEQLRQQQRQNQEFLIQQGAQQYAQRLEAELQQLAYLDGEALKQRAAQLANQAAIQQIAALRDRDEAETFRKQARKEGMSKKEIAEVEQTLQVARQNGHNPTRDQVASLIAGARLRGKLPGAAPAARSGSSSGGGGRRSARESAQDRADREKLQSITWGDVNRGYRLR